MIGLAIGLVEDVGGGQLVADGGIDIQVHPTHPFLSAAVGAIFQIIQSACATKE